MSLSMQALSGTTWHVITAQSFSGLQNNDLQFMGTTILYGAQSTVPSTPWAHDCTDDPYGRGVTAITEGGSAVLLTQTGETLTCEYLDTATDQRRGFGLGTLVGLLAGALVGLFFREPLVGALAGVAAGAAGSAAALRVSFDENSGGASGAVFVAESGSGQGGREILTYAPRAANG